MVEFENIKYKKNLRDIKSSYIIEKIFSFLNEKEKLSIIIYCKELQDLCSISTEDYKKKSGKYKIGEKNGKGKEYIINTNILIFEGEYLNGNKNGKGKEYYKNGKLKFEGEYLNGKKWNGNGYNIINEIIFEMRNGRGKGKEYDFDGKLEFEGEYLNGRKNGKGKEYDNNEILKFEGEYLNGIKNGKGKEYYLNGKLEFEGEYLNNKRWNGNGYNINTDIEFKIKDGKGNIKNMIIMVN